MILEVNSLCYHNGQSRRKSFSIEVPTTASELIKSEVRSKINVVHGHRIDNEEFVILESRRLVMHLYDLVEI